MAAEPRNCIIEIEGQTRKSKGTLTITIDLDKDLGPSKSGKTTIIGSTHGAFLLEDYGMPEVAVNVNIYEKDAKAGRGKLHRR